MFKRDIILAEMQKLALILARLVGLKEEGKQAEFNQLAEDTALKEYEIAWQDLLNMPPVDFEIWLQRQAISADKLDALAQLLYLQNEPFGASPKCKINLQKVLLIYDLLEQKHHRQSLDNIRRRKKIEIYITDNITV